MDASGVVRHIPLGIDEDMIGSPRWGLVEEFHCADLDDPISAHMSRDVTTVRQEQTVGDVLTQLRGQELGAKIVYIYVLDATGRLVGVLPTRTLLSSDPATTISSIMIAKVVC